MKECNLKWIAAFAASLTLGVLLVGLLGQPLSAQTSTKVLEVCKSAGDEVSARDLPFRIEEGQCPAEEKVITNGRIGSALPDRGQSVHVEALTMTGAQELEILHYDDGAIELKHVGNDSEVAQSAETSGGFSATGPNECRDSGFANLDHSVEGGLRYYINFAAKPRELTLRSTSLAIRRGGSNITSTRNACRLGDRVTAGLAYAGRTRLAANVSPGGRCSGVDQTSVVSFGTLPRGVLAVACTSSSTSQGPNRVVASDIKIARGTVQWTTNPGARSCKNKFDLESVITHERGHTFGLGHVSERTHGNQTMSTRINGPCESSQRTVGRGDVLGLDGKY